MRENKLITMKLTMEESMSGNSRTAGGLAWN